MNSVCLSQEEVQKLLNKERIVVTWDRWSAPDLYATLLVKEDWTVYRFRNGEMLEYPNVCYRADNSTRLFLKSDVLDYLTDDPLEIKWRYPYDMPDWMCRLLVVVTNEFDDLSSDNIGIELEGVRIRQ